jgi:formate dehydrogenase alpha subunit
LLLGQSLFHSGKLSTRSKGLLQVQSAGALSLNPADAAGRSLAEGDRVLVRNERGEARTTVHLSERIPQGIAWFPDHFAAEMTGLLDCTLDPVTKVPSFHCATVEVVKE